MDQLTAATPPAPARIDYYGKPTELARLLAIGWLLALVTLGIYRFWLITDARRFLWSHTDVAGDQLEYTGRGKELLIGFLIALAIFVPLNIAVSLAALGGTWIQGIVSIIYFCLLAMLMPFALYRARRYRLTRTTHRGIRLGLAGSGGAYALRWIGWSLLTLLTLGFAYPFQHAALERYAIGNTYYGNLRANFIGTGGRLFKSVVWIQLIAVWPLVAALIYFFRLGLLSDLVSGDYGFEPTATGAPYMRGNTEQYLIFSSLAVSWTVICVVLLYPLYRAIEFRWWTAGIKLKDMALASALKARRVYVLYLKYWGLMMLAGTVLGIVVAIVSLLVAIAFGATTFEDLAQLAQSGGGGSFTITTTALTVIAYLLAAIVFAVLYQVIVWAGFWQTAAESITMTGHEVLATASAAQLESGAFGEGVADALDIGGF